MPAEEQRSGGMRSGAHGGLMCPLEKVVRGIETGQQMPGLSWRAGKASRDGKPVGPDRPLEKGVGGIDICASEEENEIFLFPRLSLYFPPGGG